MKLQVYAPRTKQGMHPSMRPKVSNVNVRCNLFLYYGIYSSSLLFQSTPSITPSRLKISISKSITKKSRSFTINLSRPKVTSNYLAKLLIALIWPSSRLRTQNKQQQ